MSGLQALAVVFGIALAIALVVLLAVQVSRSGRRRVEKVSRELGIPLPGEVDTAVTPEAVAEEAVAEEVVAEEVAETAVRPRLRDRLGKTRSALADALRPFRSRPTVDDETWDELEDALLLADVGVGPTGAILSELRGQAKADGVSDPEGLVTLLRRELVTELSTRDGQRVLRRADDGPSVWMFIGVNGVGKTTSIAKLAKRERDAERSVLLAAADTFRAAAAEQLAEWGERIDAPVVRGQEGADPGSVVYDAMSAASGRGVEVVMIDTAGRLHTKVNLMEELRKLRRVVDKTPGALCEVLLVIDASTGQNGLAQAREFAEAVDVTGLVLTKLDGTAKGGIVLAIERELDIPVKVVGIGESPEDLVAFDALEFVDAILG